MGQDDDDCDWEVAKLHVISMVECFHQAQCKAHLKAAQDQNVAQDFGALDSGRSTSHRPSEKIPQSNARIDPPFPFLFKVPRALEAGFEVPYKRVYSPLYGEFMLSIKLGSSCIVSFPQYYVKDGRPQQPRSSGCVRVAIKQTPQAKKGQRKTSMSFISRTYEALEWGIQLNFRHMENGPLSWVISDIKRGCPLPTGDNEKKGVELDCFECDI
ncbi:hypothetical protein BSKO_02876 [Bryopsis sp. KO-2023]|nr:hypothetical protein BSKO_02876 [Bryopsis sp. KO-2023]